MPNVEPLSDANMVQETLTVRFYKFNGEASQTYFCFFQSECMLDQLIVNTSI